MKILIVTTEFGADGGGLSLSCSRIVNLLSLNHVVDVICSTDYPIEVSKGCALEKIDDSIRKEYKLKH